MIATGIRGRGELRFNFQFQTQLLLHILCTSYVLIAYWRGVWFQRGFVVSEKAMAMVTATATAAATATGMVMATAMVSAMETVMATVKAKAMA